MKQWIVAIAFLGCTSAPRPPEVTHDQPASLALLDHAPPDALELHVRVIRWACTITDPEGTQDSELHVPLGRAVRLVLTNADSFADLDIAIVGTPAHVHLPRGGAPTELAFRIDRPGTYAWQCPTELAPQALPDSATHPIDAMTPEAYAASQAAHREATAPTTREGKVAFAKTLLDHKGCFACHTIDGSPRVGPSLAGIWGTTVTLADGRTRVVDATYVETSLREPMSLHRPDYPPVMPSYEGQLRPEEIAAIVGYIESLATVKPAHN